MVGPKKRTFCTILFNIAYTMSLIILSGLVYMIRDWRQLTLATTIPFLFLFFYWWWVFVSEPFSNRERKLNKWTDIHKKKYTHTLFYVNGLQKGYANFNKYDFMSLLCLVFICFSLGCCPNLRDGFSQKAKSKNQLKF